MDAWRFFDLSEHGLYFLLSSTQHLFKNCVFPLFSLIVVLKTQRTETDIMKSANYAPINNQKEIIREKIFEAGDWIYYLLQNENFKQAELILKKYFKYKVTPDLSWVASSIWDARKAVIRSTFLQQICEIKKTERKEPSYLSKDTT